MLLSAIIMVTLGAVALESSPSGPFTLAQTQKQITILSPTKLTDQATPNPNITQVPVEGNLTSQFGPRKLKPGTRTKTHSGVDYKAPKGTPIVAAGAGSVTRSGWRGAYGRSVEIDHGQGLTTIYAHLDKTSVKSGQKVEPGSLIGKVGNTGRSTGPHLHFEVRQNNVPQDPHVYVPPQLWQKTIQIGQVRRFILGALNNHQPNQRPTHPATS